MARIGRERRKYLAENFAKTAEYIFSIVILGQVITGKFDALFSTVVIIVFFALVGVGTFILPEQENKEEV
jgi:hypothetical protein